MHDKVIFEILQDRTLPLQTFKNAFLDFWIRYIETIVNFDIDPFILCGIHPNVCASQHYQTNLNQSPSARSKPFGLFALIAFLKWTLENFTWLARHTQKD